MYSQSSGLPFPVSLLSFKIQNMGKQAVRKTERATSLPGNACSKRSFLSQRSPRQLWSLLQVAERVAASMVPPSPGSESESASPPHLEVNQRVHHKVVDLPKHRVGRSPGKDDELDPQKGHQDQGGPHRLQVYVRVLLRFLYFLHKHPDDVQQEEEVQLQRLTMF